MPSHNDPIEIRMVIGKWSEDMTVQHYKNKGFKCDKVGLDGNIKREDIMKIPKVERCKPDFKVSNWNNTLKLKHPVYVESKSGCTGRSKHDNEAPYPHFKIKLKDLEAYEEYHKKMNVYCMIHWQDPFMRKIIGLQSLLELINENKYIVLKYKQDNKEYYPIPLKDLP